LKPIQKTTVFFPLVVVFFSSSFFCIGSLIVFCPGFLLPYQCFFPFFLRRVVALYSRGFFVRLVSFAVPPLFPPGLGTTPSSNPLHFPPIFSSVSSPLWTRGLLTKRNRSLNFWSWTDICLFPVLQNFSPPSAHLFFPLAYLFLKGPEPTGPLPETSEQAFLFSNPPSWRNFSSLDSNYKLKCL